MQYDVWGKYSDEGVMYVAIVFRGTDEQRDWCSNLRAHSVPFCSDIADQYLYIAALIDQILDGIYDDWGPDRYVFAIGHSLGGGLAELAGWTSYVSQVITFDSSPVVGVELAEEVIRASLDVEVLEEYSQKHYEQTGCEYYGNNPPSGEAPFVHSVFEHGEILAYFRLLKRWFSPEHQLQSRVREYRTNVLTGSIVKQHSMKALACALRDRSRSLKP
ncbi:MAG: hypothetical protein IIA63_01035 [Nitrospinae bacterium]|nr:hypothetical protein [Nitrospinota bacterium]